MTRVDPYQRRAAEPARFYLYRLNPLAKLAAVLPAMLGIVFTRDLLTPLILLVAALVVLFTGARLSARARLGFLLGIPLAIALIAFFLSLWSDPARLAPSAILVAAGPLQISAASAAAGIATGLRLCAILVLALTSGLTTDGPDLVRAAVTHLRVSYRIGYTALAAYRFAPRFSRELQQIRAAHRVRGIATGHSPLAAVRRAAGTVIPLLAGAIRHAERVALAMDSRAFGAFDHRTERYPSPWTRRDTAYIALLWLAAAILFTWTVVSGVPSADTVVRR